MFTDQTRLEDWARAVAEASPDLDDEGQRIAVQTYRLLSRGEPVLPSEIAAAADVGVDRAQDSLRSWPLVFWDDQGRVIGFWGLAIDPLQPTHALEADGATVYGWCAWDTLFITEILGTETRVSSVDPNDGTSIELILTPDGVVRLDPPEAVVSLLLPDGEFGAETISQFCHRIHFFSSADSARHWIGDRPLLFAVDVDEAFELGRLANRLRLGDGHYLDRSSPTRSP
jgi:alkylmercury lyase